MSVSDMTHLHVWHDSCLCVTWLILMCGMTHVYVRHDSFTCVTSLIHMCDMTHAYAWHDSFTCAAWLILCTYNFEKIIGRKLWGLPLSSSRGNFRRDMSHFQKFQSCVQILNRFRKKKWIFIILLVLENPTFHSRNDWISLFPKNLVVQIHCSFDSSLSGLSST